MRKIDEEIRKKYIAIIENKRKEDEHWKTLSVYIQFFDSEEEYKDVESHIDTNVSGLSIQVLWHGYVDSISKYELYDEREKGKMVCKAICDILKANKLKIEDVEKYIHEEIGGIEYGGTGGWGVSPKAP